MKAIFWIGLASLIPGIASLLILPRSEQEGFRAGGVSMGIESRYQDELAPIVSAVMILGGPGTMIARKARTL